ncbi:General transcription factor IIE subunit 1 [Chytriomyces hyalinus]|nr:General transcription factor IIE subunit 1 [Chytriomyces hyalinus]
MSVEERPVKTVLTELIMTVARNYYQQHFIIILDILALRGAVKEEDMAAALRISPLDTRKMCKKLELDRIIKANSTMIVLNHGKYAKKTTKTYYYIDYKSFLNVIKYKMVMIQELIKKEIDEHNKNLSYFCPKCTSKYDPFQVLRMIRPEDGMFVCEHCQVVLEQEKGTDFENDLSRRFNTERTPILNLLRQTEGRDIPEFVPPSDAEIATTSAAGAAAQAYALPNQVKVELDGDDGNDVLRADQFENGFDEYESKVDDKDALMQEYYQRLQEQVKSAQPAPVPVSSSMSSTALPPQSILGGNFNIFGKREEDFGDTANKKQRPNEEDSDEDEVFEEI